jgi:Icc-related predicted phosphoesterase
MLILHISDWHGKGAIPGELLDILEARMPDVVAITGDMLFDGDSPWTREPVVQSLQHQYWETLYRNLRETFPGIPILAVPGNHERINYLDLKEAREDSLFHSFDTSEPKRYEVQGIVFSGFRGTTEHGNRWHYELNEDAQDWILTEVPKDTQVLLTHAPPVGIMDEFEGRRVDPRDFTRKLMNSGALMQMTKLYERFPELLAHLFGHIHECKGVDEQYGITYSNAATGWNWVAI